MSTTEKSKGLIQHFHIETGRCLVTAPKVQYEYRFIAPQPKTSHEALSLFNEMGANGWQFVFRDYDGLYFARMVSCEATTHQSVAVDGESLREEAQRLVDEKRSEAESRQSNTNESDKQEARIAATQKSEVERAKREPTEER
jgi:hypothetical protein